MARNILVVEDDHNISDLIRMYLEKEGFEVRIAYDGGKAVEEYDAKAPDMVLLDIMLPVMDGWSVCAHIREKGSTPIIMLTARGEKPVRAGGRFLIIDGGFCEKYHNKTGIAGYTLVSDDHGMRIKAHLPFESVEAALARNADIGEASVTEITRSERRLHVSDTDVGAHIRGQIRDLQALLDAYRTGELPEHAQRR